MSVSSIHPTNKARTIVGLHSAKEASELMQGLTNLILKGDERCVELKASVRLSLGVALELNGLFEEAAETYKSLLSENEQGTDSSRFRVNLGNLHFRKNEFPAALKMYRMALDRVSAMDWNSEELKKCALGV